MPKSQDTAPTGAPSRSEKIIAQALASLPAIKQILESIEEVLGPDAQRPASQPSAQSVDQEPFPELPKMLQDYLLDQQRSAYELQDLLERLNAENDTPVCLGTAARLAAELQKAPELATITRVVKTAAPSVTPSAFPTDTKLQVIKAISGATRLSTAETKKRAENLSARMRALLSNIDFAEELETPGATVQVRA